MKKVLLSLALTFGLGHGCIAAEAIAKNYTPLRVAVVCFFKYEQVSGMNKICYYDCLGSAAAITISSVKLCPLSING